ncbi:MAG: hypothetical protein SGILL_010825, partial [Bacillariaceae sp.]
MNDHTNSSNNTARKTGKTSKEIPPLKYSPKDYILFFEVGREDDEAWRVADEASAWAFKREAYKRPKKIWFSAVIPGEEVPEFFRDGTIDYRLDRPVQDVFPTSTQWKNLGAYYDHIRREIRRRQSTLEPPGICAGFRAILHVWRKQDRKLITISDCSYYGILDKDTSPLKPSDDENED